MLTHLVNQGRHPWGAKRPEDDGPTSFNADLPHTINLKYITLVIKPNFSKLSFILLGKNMNDIRILVLEGTKYNMGIDYGKQLEEELHISLSILQKFFIEQRNISFDKLLEKSEEFYNRYPASYQKFIEGVAIGSNLSLDEAKILNAMEILRSLVDGQETLGGCSFINIPGAKTTSGANIIGRNYDYAGLPYKLIAQHLTLTILKESDMVPTAFIAMPGQIYAPTAINAASLFISLNNAMPSGGFVVNNQHQSLLINLLIALQTSQNFAQLDNQFQLLNSDFSLVINAADQHHLKSYEYSAFQNMKYYLPEDDLSFASTNFYLHQDWDMPPPTDELTWDGVSRRNNLLLQTSGETYSSKNLMDLLEIDLNLGGAKLDTTIYQIVFDTKSKDLYLKRTQQDASWTHINLSKLFS